MNLPQTNRPADGGNGGGNGSGSGGCVAEGANTYTSVTFDGGGAGADASAGGDSIAYLPAASSASVAFTTGTVRNFDRNLHSMMPSFSHACSLEASKGVANGIHLGCPRFLPVGTINYVQTLKALPQMAVQVGGVDSP
jgi:hypothetical protein